ncbi:c-type cytochrome [Paenalcaligenes hominis]|uniref:c-type cytochrome n=1 Tax=Paenalcaligenes hominis TaxID=643674 RepID=UPI0035238CE0
MKIKYLALCLPLVFGASVAKAEAASFEKVQEILQKNACLACHQVDNKVVGPAYKEVAEKYKDDPANAELLTKHIKEGSQGVWGAIPMPPNVGITDEDLTVVVDWLMAGAPN